MGKRFDSRTIRELSYVITAQENYRKIFFEDNHFYGFKKISEERRDYIIKKAFDWNLINSKLVGNKKLEQIYLLLTKGKRNFDIERDDESYLFLIMAIDPELKLLEMSYEESKKENLVRRFSEEFNMKYDSRFLDLEKYYNKRFPTLTDQFTRS